MLSHTHSISHCTAPHPQTVINLNAMGGSRALVIAAVWTGIVHLILAVLGTFILKRFPTSFSIGFLLGILLVVANQNLILFGTFQGYSYGVPATNRAFGILGFALFLMLTFFAALLFHFKNHIVVAPIDVKGGVGGFGPRANNGNSGSGANRDNPADETSSSYRQHNADGEDYEASDA